MNTKTRRRKVKEELNHKALKIKYLLSTDCFVVPPRNDGFVVGFGFLVVKNLLA